MQRLTFFIVILFTFLLTVYASSVVPIPVSKTNKMPVYIHYMPWFDTPETSGYGGWGWHWTMNNKNPNKIVDPVTGKREIASHYYPLIGPYASSDPNVIEYHLLLMKYSGIDGALIDWYGTQGTIPDIGNLLRNSNAFINQTSHVGLKFGLIFEDRFIQTIASGKASMVYAKNNYFNQAGYIRNSTNKHPFLGVFGPLTFHNPSDWTEILSGAGETVDFFPLWGQASDGGNNSAGEYVWVWEDAKLGNYYSNMQNYYKNVAPKLKCVMGGVYPGFNDFYAEGGAGSSYFNIPHNNGSTLDQVIGLVNLNKNIIEMVQFITWNDFGEGTIFEPTFETGFSYLVKIQKYTGVQYGQSELQEIYRLYNLRKKFNTNIAKQQQLNLAFQYFVSLKVKEASIILDAVEKTN